MPSRAIVTWDTAIHELRSICGLDTVVDENFSNSILQGEPEGPVNEAAVFVPTALVW